MKRTATPIRSSRRARATHRVSTGFALAPLALAALVLTQGAQALPTGMQPVVGTVQVTRPDANTMVMTTGQQKTIVNTQTFGIGAQERLTVNQPGGTSTTMFSVLGYDPSYILGQMQSNGRIFLQNPNGIVFGANARVDVGGLVATTLHLSDTDFLAGRYLLTDNGQGQGDLAGRVINQGTINAPGGAVVLAGADVLNSGTIQADGGRVGLIAANKVLVDVEGDGLLFFEVDGREAGTRLQQLGRIQADGGSVELMAASRGQFADTVLNMSGVVQARTLGVKEGRVVIDGGSTGITLVSGEVDVSGNQAGEKGGTVTVLGDKVGLVGAARINASGDAGGGTVLVGGDVHGTGERHANSTYVGSKASIDASAKTRGDGGKVVVWADGTTRYFGQINARGGLLGGNGGFAEVSGRGHLDFLGSVDLSATNGTKGVLLLDPSNIEIVANTADANKTGAATPDAAPANDLLASDDTGSDPGLQFFATSGAPDSVSKISSGAVVAQLNNADVQLTASHNITVGAAIDASGNTDSHGLTLTAGNGSGDAVILKANVVTKGGLVLQGRNIKVSDNDVTLDAGSGRLSLQAAIDGGGKSLKLVSGSATAEAVKTSDAINNVSALDVTGSATLGGNVTTTGTQTYNQAVTLSQAGVTTLTGNTVTLKSTLDATTAGVQGVKVAGNASFANAVGGGKKLASVEVTGQSTLGGNVTTTGNQTYGDRVTLGGNATLDADTAKVSLAGVDGATHDLALKSSNSADDAIKTGGAISNVAALTVTGKSTLGGDVTTTGTQTYSGDVTLAGATNFKGSSLGFAGIKAGANNVGLRANAITVGGSVSSSGGNTVTFEPLSGTDGVISVAGGAPSASGTLQLSQALLDKFNGFATIVLGSTANAYKIAVGDFSLPTDVMVRSSSGQLSFGALAKQHALSAQTTGLIELNSVVGGTTDPDKLASLSLNGGQVHINTTQVRTTGAQSYTASSGDVALSQDTVLDAGGGTITSSTIDGGGHSLNLVGSGGVQVGAINHVSTLSVTGSATLGGDVTTTGTQTYNQAVTLSQAGVTTLTGTTVTLKSTLDATADGAQGVKVAGNASFGSAVGGGKKLASVEVTGQSTLGGDVTTTGTQTYQHAVTLSRAGVTTLTGSTVSALSTLDATNDGDQGVKVVGNANLTGPVGGGKKLSSLEVTGQTALGGNVSTTGNQTYGNTVTLGAAGLYTFTGQALKFNNGLVAGTNDLAFHADSALDITGALSGTGHVSIAGQSADKNIAVGGAGGASDLQITDSTLALLGTGAANFSGVTIGRADGTGTITFANYTLTRDLTVLNGSGAINFGALDGAHALTATTTDGLITLNGNVGNISQPTALTFNSAVRLNNSFVFTSGAQAYNGAVSLGQNVQLNASGVSFAATVDSADATPRALTINAPTSVAFGGAVGQTHALASLDVNSAETRVKGDVTVALDGHQTYAGNVVLDGDTTFKAHTLNFGGAVAAGDHELGLLADSPVLPPGGMTGNKGLTVGAFTDSTTIGVDGGTGALQVATSGGFNRVTVGSSTGTGEINLGITGGTAVSLSKDLTLQSASGNINVNTQVDGAHSLTMNTGGVITVGAAVGSGTALSTLTTGGAGGTTQLNANVTTSGDQTYGHAVVIGAAVVTQAGTTAAPSTVHFADRVDGVSSGAGSLTVTGRARFDAAVGSAQRLASLAVYGPAQLGANISTTGYQMYAGAVTLTHDVALDSSGSYVYVPSNGSVDGAFNLSLSSVLGSASYLYGTIGATTPLRSLTVNGATVLRTDAITTTGDQTYGGIVTAYQPSTTFAGSDVAFNGGLSASGDVHVDAGGTATLGGTSVSVANLGVSHAALINATSVTTNGTQSYGGDVTLGNTTTLSGNTVTFGGTVQAATNGVQGLTVNDSGTTTFHGDVGGGGHALASLTTSAGGTTVLPGRVTTTGAQSYGDVAQLATTTALSASAVSFNGGLLGGNQGLTVHLPAAGTLLFKGSVTDLGSLLVDGGGRTQFDGTNGLTTSGAQQYGGEVEILNGADARFVASALRFDGKVSGTRNLVLNADTIVAGELAGTGELQVAPTSAGRSISLTGDAADVSINLNQVSGFTQRTIGRADGTGAISAGALHLTGNTTVQSGTGDLNFNGAIEGPYALSAQTGGAVTFGGDIGGDPANALGPKELSNLNVSSGQALTLHNVYVSGGGTIKTAGQLELAGTLQLDGGTLTLESTAAPGAGSKILDANGNPSDQFLLNNRLLKEAAVAINQTGGTVTTAAGSTLNLRASGGGSIVVDSATNDIKGNLSAVSGTPGEVGGARFAAGTTDPLVANAIRLRSSQMHAAGIEGDVVKLTAGSLNTVAGTKIRARLPYVNAQGVLTSMPALTLVPTQPTVVNQYGTAAPSSWIQVEVGDATGGYVTVRPTGAGSGSSVIYLGGLDGQVPFYDGTGKASEIQVYYNGRTPSTPQEVGALSAVTSVIEESRRSRFEEVVRTENVSARLRTGVIAEVGSGRPATVGSESIRMPASCTPNNRLGC